MSKQEKRWQMYSDKTKYKKGDKVILSTSDVSLLFTCIKNSKGNNPTNKEFFKYEGIFLISKDLYEILKKD